MFPVMAVRVELRTTGADKAPLTVPVSQLPFVIGRGPENDLVVTDPRVSWQHALLQTDASRLLVRDLGSANGTYVNDRRLFETTQIRDGDQLRLGPDVSFVVGIQYVEEELPERIVEVLSAGAGGRGIRLPFRGACFTFGAGEGVDFRLDSGPPLAATLQQLPGHTTTLERQGSSALLEIGAQFEIEGRSFRVLSVGEEAYGATSESPTYPYRLVVRLDGERGHTARFDQLYIPGRRCRIAPGVRGDLLYLLARKLEQDRKARLHQDEQGWCSREEVLSGVWGRAGAAQGHRNRVNVLVHRLRKELMDTGFDPNCIEVRRGRLRVCVSEVELAT